MTQKDYVRIAAALQAAQPALRQMLGAGSGDAALHVVTSRVADALEAERPGTFDRQRFMRAAEVGDLRRRVPAEAQPS